MQQQPLVSIQSAGASPYLSLSTFGLAYACLCALAAPVANHTPVYP